MLITTAEKLLFFFFFPETVLLLKWIIHRLVCTVFIGTAF